MPAVTADYAPLANPKSVWHTPSMPDPENLTLVYLRRIDEKLDRLADDMLEVKERLGTLEANYASVSRRIDRMELRMDRIESRLDIADAPAG